MLLISIYRTLRQYNTKNTRVYAFHSKCC